MTPATALENLVAASREAKMTYNDHAVIEQSAILLRSVLTEHAKLKAESKTTQSDQ